MQRSKPLQKNTVQCSVNLHWIPISEFCRSKTRSNGERALMQFNLSVAAVNDSQWKWSNLIFSRPRRVYCFIGLLVSQSTLMLDTYCKLERKSSVRKQNNTLPIIEWLRMIKLGTCINHYWNGRYLRKQVQEKIMNILLWMQSLKTSSPREAGYVQL